MATYVLDKETGLLVPKTRPSEPMPTPAGMVKDGGGVNYAGQRVPLSRSLPLDDRPGVRETAYGREVIRHADGTMSLPGGQRICDTAENTRKHAESCGRRRVE